VRPGEQAVCSASGGGQGSWPQAEKGKSITSVRLIRRGDVISPGRVHERSGARDQPILARVTEQGRAHLVLALLRAVIG
jgi:hypothetical protein